ncbi:MAG: hypothetical protein ACKO1T_05500 [Sediminibacterium sp.]
MSDSAANFTNTLGNAKEAGLPFRSSSVRFLALLELPDKKNFFSEGSSAGGGDPAA